MSKEFERLYEASVYMSLVLDKLYDELEYSVSSLVKTLGEMVEVAAQLDEFVGCGRGYKKLNVETKQLEKLISRDQLYETFRIISMYLYTSGKLAKTYRDDLIEIYKNKPDDEKIAKVMKREICTVAAELAYLSVGVQYVLRTLGGEEMSLIKKLEKLYYINKDIHEQLIKILEKVNTNFAEAVSDLVELIVEADIALDCKLGYAGVKWPSKEEIEKYRPWNKYIHGMPLTESLGRAIATYSAFIDLDRDEILKLMKKAFVAAEFGPYRTKINEKIEKKKKLLCETIEAFAYDVAAIYCVLMGYPGGGVEMGKIRCASRVG